MAKVINKTITTHLTNMKDGDVVNLSIKIQKCVVVAGKNLMELVTKH